MSLLIIDRGINAGKRIPIAHFPATIGRDATNSVVLEDQEVSRFHFRIKKRGRLFVIEDLDSRNSTYLNGDKILNSVIQSGDKILVGHTELVFLSADSSINIASELLHMDMVLAEELGIHAPLNINLSDNPKKPHPVRIKRIHSSDMHAHDPREIKQIFDLNANILITNDLDEASNVLLKSLGQIVPAADRAAFFLWQKPARILMPKSYRHFRNKGSFHLSQRAFEDVLARKHGLLLQGEKAANITQSEKNRLILPLLAGDEPIGILHIESDSPKNIFVQKHIELLQALLTLCSPTFDSLLLKQELDSWMGGMVETMIATLEAKDTYTHGHSERVSRYSMAIAEELRLSRELKKLLLMSSLCHDIGKVGIPDAILKKASMLSAEEYQEMKLHPTVGADIVSHMPNAKRFISGVKYHHERWDGTGYPDGLAGEDIPFFGRIVGVADAFDAMVSGRSYSGFMDQSDAVTALVKENDMFDREVLKAFSRAFDNGKLTLKTITQNNKVPEEKVEPVKVHKKTMTPHRLKSKKK